MVSLLSGSFAATVAADPYFVFTESGYFRVRENPVKYKLQKVVRKSWGRCKEMSGLM